MANMRFNHMELTFPPGTLTNEFRDRIAAFYSDVLGWESKSVPIVGQQGHFMRVDDDQFILLLENEAPMNRPRFDHLGLLMDSRGEVDETLGRCRDYQERHAEVEIKTYDDLVMETTVVHAFYFRYLLPIHFDVQVIEAVD